MQRHINWWLRINNNIRYIVICFLALSFGTGLKAQFQYDNQWVFSFEDDTTSILDFREDSLIVRRVFQDLQLGSTNGTISDSDGNLLFYSNGCEIRDATFQLMENGDGLNPGEVADDKCDRRYTAGHQSLMILPSLTNDSIYHIFHKRIIFDFEQSPFVVTDSLFHTIISIQNNGLGQVVEKNIPINTQWLSNSYLNAVKKTDGDGWWIISAVYNSNEYELFHLDSLGNIEVKNQNIGPEIDETDDILQTILSPKGDLYVRAFSDRGIYLFDFDRAVGEFSNVRHIPFTIEPRFGGAAISSNGRFLYVNSSLEIWQFDLESANIEESKTLIAAYDGYQSPFATTFSKGQLAPDCKIYYTTGNGTDVLHVMHNPNVKGTACNFEQHGVQLYTSHGISLPYFPSYRLDTDYPICDTTKLVATSINIPLAPQDQVWATAPNPTDGVFHLATNKIISNETHVFIYDASGRLMANQKMPMGKKSMELDISNQLSGVYFYQVIDSDGRSSSGRVVKY